MPSSDLQSAFNLRRCILAHLYNWFKEYPLAAVEIQQLAESCRASAKEINWNLVYLGKKGWIKSDFSGECPPFAACTVELTGAGIDLAENPAALERLGQE